MTAPRRRWSFSLRALFVMVTVLAASLGWLMHQRRLVQERTTTLAWLKQGHGLCLDSFTGHWPIKKWLLDHEPRARPSLPRTWQRLGATPVQYIALSEGAFTAAEKDRVAQLFPEAFICLARPRGFAVFANPPATQAARAD